MIERTRLPPRRVWDTIAWRAVRNSRYAMCWQSNRSPVNARSDHRGCLRGRRRTGWRHIGLPAGVGGDRHRCGGSRRRCRRWNIRLSMAAPMPSPPARVDCCEEAGVWDRLPEPTCPIMDIRVSDGRLGRPASPLFLHFDHREAGGDPVLPAASGGEVRAPSDGGPFGWMVEARSLRMALNARMHALPALRIFAPAEVDVARCDDGATVQIIGGPHIACRLVVAAEGRNSPLRQAAGIPVTRSAVQPDRHRLRCQPRDAAPQHGAGTLPAVRPIRATADVRQSRCHDGGAPNVSAIVWTERTPIALRMLAAGRRAVRPRDRATAGQHLGAVHPIGRRWSYPLSAMLAHRYSTRGWCWWAMRRMAIHPIAGQGLNLGFRDAIALSELLIAASQRGDDPGAPPLLRHYQRQRRPENLLMLAATDALDRLFSNDNPLVAAGARYRHRRGAPHVATEAAVHAPSDGTAAPSSACHCEGRSGAPISDQLGFAGSGSALRCALRNDSRTRLVRAKVAYP